MLASAKAGLCGRRSRAGEDIDATVDGLSERGVAFERYEGMEQDDRGISRSGPDIAWFRDPAGNVMSVIQASS